MLVCFVAGTTLLMNGCGTTANVLWFNRDEGGMRVYGGVRAEWTVAQESLAAASDPSASSPGPVWLLIADMPLSAVADTVTLPLTVPVSLWWALHPVNRERPATNPLDAREQSAVPINQPMSGTTTTPLPPPTGAKQSPP
jgi:uncharacterized protein YceK